MNRTIRLVLAAVALGCFGLRSIFAGDQPSRSVDDAETFFELKVRPALTAHCVKCHGAKKASGGLRLDDRDALLKGGETGPAIAPGNPGESLLVHAIRREDESLKMPPDKPLPEPIRKDLEAWIAAGAAWPKGPSQRPSTTDAKPHWAFEPLKTQAPPADPAGWAGENPIDRWIAASRREHRVAPVKSADKRTLIRRASFDLTGLPPAPERVESFLADQSPDAFSRLVDELLESPRYGERWGRYWLDLARYADTAGDNSDYPIPQAYLYRDYVIDAFNADIPYDRFLHEQLAGDILACAGPAQYYARKVVATGFLAQAKRFGTRKLEDMHLIIEDTLHTTGQVVLGLSLRCARCHDHKFDPLTSRDYYALYGFFASTGYPFAGAEEDHKQSEFAPLVPPAVIEARRKARDEAIAKIKAEIASRESTDPNAIRVQEIDASLSVWNARREEIDGIEKFSSITALIGELNAERTAANDRATAALKPLRDELARIEKESPLAGVQTAYAVHEGTPTDAKFQKGGDPRKPGEVVRRGVPKILDASGTIAIPPETSGRLELARWLTDGPPKPLVARVMANRVWQRHFGKPIVATPSDFGLRGTPPTHPELLDLLASEFIKSGWSIKAMHRKIMLSKTYQLSSEFDASNAEIDSGNSWYWRFDRRPLDAEALRDSLLELSGSLLIDRPGPHPFPPQEKWRFTAHHQFHAYYESNHRTIYQMVQRMQPHPYLSLFNGPDTSMTTPVRDDSTLPLQSLYLLNGEFVHKRSHEFAQRLIATESDDLSRIDRAFLKAYSRPASTEEKTRIEANLNRYRAALAAESVPAEQREVETWASLTRAIMASNEFIFVD